MEINSKTEIDENQMLEENTDVKDQGEHSSERDTIELKEMRIELMELR